MKTSVTLDKAHFKVVQDKSKALGITPERFLAAIIDAQGRSLDEILKPVRQGFAKTTDEELDGLFQEARRAARGRTRVRK